MNKPRTIIAVAVAVYLATLGVAWNVVTRHALAKTTKLLEQAEVIYVDSIGDNVDAILIHSAVEIMQELGNTAVRIPIERLRQIKDHFCIDEINIVGTNGVAISSTIPDGEGFDYASHPLTAGYLDLLHGKRYFAQPFRMGVSNPDKFRKYLGMPFADGSGFIQVGYNFQRLIDAMLYLDAKSLREWRIGRTGHYDFYDVDFDGNCDLTGLDELDRVITRRDAQGETVYLRPFTYAGCRFLAVLPEREYFGERDLNFMIMAPTLAGIILFFAWLVLSMARSADRDRRHREAEDAVRDRDLAMAKTIQLSVLPTPDVFRRNLFSVSLHAVTHPAREVGGDFYDFYPLDKSHVAIVVADVSGKGIPAAMFMMKAKNEICNAVCSEHDLALAVAEANAAICENNEAEMFVTAWIGVLDIQSGELAYVNAGHNRPFVRRADGSLEKVSGKGGVFLGMFPDAVYRVNHLVFRPDDLFFLFTDGVTEAMDVSRNLFGEERLCRVLADVPPDPESAIAAVDGSVCEFASGAEQSDDRTCLALRWHGNGGRSFHSFPAEEASYGPAMEWLGKAIALTGRSSRARLLNAADEVMTNIVSYSGSGEFSISVENAPGRTRLVFSDSGREYNPLSHVDPDTHLPLADRPIGGLGILITKRLVDATSYIREDGRNVITLVKFDMTKGTVK